MNYELAKQLKDAGFPLNMSDHLECDYNHTEFIDRVWYHIPTLSELIEACGEGFWSLTKHINFWQTNWRDGIGGDTAGKTPEEAVANLWLAINKK